MVLFAWAVNVAVALVLALPLFHQLDAYIGDTVRGEELVRGLSENWYKTWQLDMVGSELARNVDYSLFGYAPFLNHTETVLAGTVVKAVGDFFYDLLFRLRIGTPGLLVGLTFLYVLLSTFLAGAFIGTYAKDYRVSFTEFLMEGAKHFGRFFRLSLFALVLYYLLFLWLFDWATDSIPVWTANEPSEMTPFVYYMVKNVLVFFLLSVVTMCVDYAKIRVVVEDRISVLVALAAGTRFALKNFRKTFGLYLLLSLIGVVFIVVYAILERQIPQHTFRMIFLALVLGQVYLIARIGLKVSFYACQTALYRQVSGGQS